MNNLNRPITVWKLVRAHRTCSHLTRARSKTSSIHFYFLSNTPAVESLSLSFSPKMATVLELQPPPPLPAAAHRLRTPFPSTSHRLTSLSNSRGRSPSLSCTAQIVSLFFQSLGLGRICKHKVCFQFFFVNFDFCFIHL